LAEYQIADWHGFSFRYAPTRIYELKCPVIKYVRVLYGGCQGKALKVVRV
jgi:hypothetical protein